MSKRRPPSSRSTLPPPNKKRKQTYPSIEEITFDFSSREDYLTGFHKRKQARIKHAKEIAGQKEREEKNEMRRAGREEREREAKERVRAVNAAMEDFEGNLAGKGSEDEEVGEEDGVSEAEEDDDGGGEGRLGGVGRREAEYMDEDKYATVTVEEVEVSKEGMKTIGDDEEEDVDDASTSGLSKGRAANGRGTTAKNTKKKALTKPKIRKKKFRYESKGERLHTKQKQRLGKKARAEKRKAA